MSIRRGAAIGSIFYGAWLLVIACVLAALPNGVQPIETTSTSSTTVVQVTTTTTVASTTTTTEVATTTTEAATTTTLDEVVTTTEPPTTAPPATRPPATEPATTEPAITEATEPPSSGGCDRAMVGVRAVGLPDGFVVHCSAEYTEGHAGLAYMAPGGGGYVAFNPATGNYEGVGAHEACHTWDFVTTGTSYEADADACARAHGYPNPYGD